MQKESHPTTATQSISGSVSYTHLDVYKRQPLTGKGTLVISCEDGDSYRYHVDETEVTVTGGGSVILLNDYMPVIPSVTVTEETALSWQIGNDRFQKSVNAGTWTFPELELVHGENSIEIITDGTVTFRYREGRL